MAEKVENINRLPPAGTYFRAVTQIHPDHDILVYCMRPGLVAGGGNSMAETWNESWALS